MFNCRPCGVFDNRLVGWGSRLNSTFIRPRIVGGKEVKKAPRPWITYVEVKAKDNTFHCGGSIVNAR